MPVENQFETETNDKGEVIRVTLVKKRTPKAVKSSEKQLTNPEHP